MNSPENPGTRIAYIVKMFPRISETFILNEILELERLGLEITIFSVKKPNEGKFHPQLSNLKARVHYLEGLETKKWINWIGDSWDLISPFKDRFWNMVEMALTNNESYKIEHVLQAAWIAARAKEFGVKHFHAHFASLPSTLAYYSGRISGIPFSYTAHAKDIFVYSMNDYQIPEKLKAAGFTVTVTRYNYNYLLSQVPDIDPESLKVIHNGVDLDKRENPDDLNKSGNTILAVSRLVPKKGFDTLLDACRILKDSGISFRCLIAGDGSEALNLQRQQKELGLSADVEFLGPKRQNEVRELMSQATIMCLPCRIAEDGNRDALPTVLLEALACGLPVISTDISGIPEIIDSEQDGILVEPDNPEILAEQIKRLLASDELRGKFAVAGRKKAEQKFDLRKNIKSLYDLFLKSSGSANVI